MRKLIIFSHLSLDGRASLPSGDLSWVSYDQDLADWAQKIVAETDTAVYGRVTYELMKYWQTVPNNPQATEHELAHARWIEDVEKIVFSRTMDSSDWNNTHLFHEITEEHIRVLKEKPGKNITVFGSPSVASKLIALGLVDEYYLSLNPVFLGEGKILFQEMKERGALKLIDEEKLSSGVLTLHYKTA